jgi:hypothetical protein
MDAGFGAEAEPTPPDPVPGFVGFFLARIQDDSAVCNARIAKDKISLGSGEILKCGGISCGR